MGVVELVESIPEPGTEADFEIESWDMFNWGEIGEGCGEFGKEAIVGELDGDV
jgi:hypothetical protein